MCYLVLDTHDAVHVARAKCHRGGVLDCATIPRNACTVTELDRRAVLSVKSQKNQGKRGAGKRGAWPRFEKWLIARKHKIAMLHGRRATVSEPRTMAARRVVEVKVPRVAQVLRHMPSGWEPSHTGHGLPLHCLTYIAVQKGQSPTHMRVVVQPLSPPQLTLGSSTSVLLPGVGLRPGGRTAPPLTTR